MADGNIAKSPYVFLLLLLCFLPKDTFKNKRQSIIFKGTVVIITAIALYFVFVTANDTALTAPLSVADNIAYVGDLRSTGSNMMGQISFIVHNPFTYARILLRSLVKSFYGYCFGIDPWLLYAYAGHFAKGFAGITTALLLGVGLIQPKKERDYILTKQVKILLGVMVFGLMAVVWTSMYVSYTAVGAKHIVGVQARYYIPFILPLLLLLKNNKITNKFTNVISDVLYYRILFATVWFLSAYGIYTLLLKPMCM